MKLLIGKLVLTSDAARLELRRKVHRLALDAGCDPVEAALGVAQVSEQSRAVLESRHNGEPAAMVQAWLSGNEGRWRLEIELPSQRSVLLGLPRQTPFQWTLDSAFEPEWVETQRKAFAEPSRETLMEELSARNRELQEHREQLERTVEKRTEELREALVRADAANEAKGAFLAAMSHEIRTPMNAIMNMVETVLESDLEPQQEEYLRVANSSAHHLLSLVNDILDFSKIEAGRIILEELPFSLHALVEGIGDMFRVSMADSKVELICRIDPGTPDGVRGDPSRLRQILLNLVGNAFKFTQRGEIILRASLSQAGDGGVRIVVQDSGIGISAEQQSQLFRPFVQADSSITRRYGGTGLGLSISRRLANLMGGDITIESVVGVGTSFLVDLPLAHEPSANRSLLALPDALRKGSILVVEDHVASREALTQMLTTHGLDCVAFASVPEAAEWLNKRVPTVAAIVDWHLGEGAMDGLAGIQLLRGMRAGSLHCILTSTVAGREAQEKAKACGAMVSIPKPLSWPVLHTALMVAIGEIPPSKAASSTPQTGQAFPGVLALLVEDHPQNQLVAKILLKKLGISIEIAENGKLALEMVGANPGRYQLILMDVQMPEMDGLEATRRIRAMGEEKQQLKSIPIIAMTASVMKSELHACIDAGMNGYVLKPLDRTVLFAELQKVLGVRAATMGDPAAK